MISAQELQNIRDELAHYKQTAQELDGRVKTLQQEKSDLMKSLHTITFNIAASWLWGDAAGDKTRLATLQGVALARHKQAHTATLAEVWEAVQAMIDQGHSEAPAAQEYLLKWARDKWGADLEPITLKAQHGQEIIRGCCPC